MDALKGFVPVALALSLGRRWADPPYVLASMAAFFAILGHIFPVWLEFHGGKGVATGLGSWIGLAPKGVLVMVVVFVVMVALFRYISLGSITAAAIFPVAARVLHDFHQTPSMLGFMGASSLLIIWKHRPNLRRLAARIVEARNARNRADKLADSLLELVPAESERGGSVPIRELLQEVRDAIAPFVGPGR